MPRKGEYAVGGPIVAVRHDNAGRVEELVLKVVWVAPHLETWQSLSNPSERTFVLNEATAQRLAAGASPEPGTWVLAVVRQRARSYDFEARLVTNWE